jgi:ABC-type Fe3+ transport system substrate-binding protein
MRRWRASTLLVVASAVALVAAACGGDDDDSDEATATTAEQPDATGEAGTWEPGAAWDAGAPPEWDDILTAARDEGEVVVGGFPFLEEPMEEAFERDTGIRLEYLGGDGGEISARLEQETRAGNPTLDLILGGGTELETLLPDDLLADIKTQMILPGVQDGSWWRNGESQWYDNAGRHLLEGSGWVFGYVVVNADEVDPDSIASWDDLLEPEFTGKIIAYDPSVQGPGAGAATAMGVGGPGLDFLEELFVGQEVELVQDNQQVIEAVARGTHPVGLFALQSQIEDFREEGFNLEVVAPEDFPGYLSSGFSVLKGPVDPPHPNAAQVFVNWYASVPGQEVYQSVVLETSNRQDTDKSELPEYVVPQDGVEYFEDSNEDYRLTDRREVGDALIAMLGGR